MAAGPRSDKTGGDGLSVIASEAKQSRPAYHWIASSCFGFASQSSQ
jgi:hypothetical protein